jgi:hypothetical protein
VKLYEVPLDDARWTWPRGQASRATFAGSECIRFADTASFIGAPRGVRLRDGTIELDLAVGSGRAFHGLAWRRDARAHTYESFFVRPHQVGNPDAVQYTPVFHDVSAWQLYHGPGYWAPVEFPVGRWFRLRVAFAGSHGEAYLDDMDRPALVFGGLKAPCAAGGIGILVGGPGLHVRRFSYTDETPLLHGPLLRRVRNRPGTITGWWVSAPVREGSALRAATGWQHLACEPGGLANLARLHPVKRGRDTVFARATIQGEAARTRSLQLGFSDRAVVYLNGQRLFSGNDTYRSRDYRFLGSIGYWYTLQLPLRHGENELVVAVSESFGGWGLMARLLDR